MIFCNRENKYKALMLDYMLENRFCAIEDNYKSFATNYIRFRLIDKPNNTDYLIHDLNWYGLYHIKSNILNYLKYINKKKEVD